AGAAPPPRGAGGPAGPRPAAPGAGPADAPPELPAAIRPRLLGAMQAPAWLDQYPWTVMPSMLAQVDWQMSAISHQPGPWQVRLTPKKPPPSGSGGELSGS